MITIQRERKNQRVAFLTSLGVHALLFVALLFLVSWQAPDPPLGSLGYGGVEVNLGFDDQGFGDIQPETPVGSEGTKEEEPSKSEPVKEEVVETKPLEPEITSDDKESPVVVKEKKEEKKEEKKAVVEKPVEKPVETKKEPEKKADPNATYKSNSQTSESTNKTTDGKAGQAGNHGDDPGTVGDKGNPEGSLDAKSLYGNPGGGGGNGKSLEIAGWDWDKVPNPVVPNNESGRIVFEITVNSEGELERVTVSENSLGPEATKACRDAVQRLTFTRTGTNVPALSKGKITFVVRAK